MTPERIPLQRIKVPFDIWNQRLRKGCELHDRTEDLVCITNAQRLWLTF
jgi:hypothetical protein